MSFTKGMRRTTESEMKEMTDMLFKWGQRLSHTPFGNFKGAKEHQVGRLKVRPKLKSFTPQLSSWEEIKWRPLNPYHKHYWKSLLGFLSNWCIHAITAPKLGWHQSSPRSVVRRIEEFNGKNET